MATERTIQRNHIVYHKGGTVWAKGTLRNGTPTGYWEWFRKNGTTLRSGRFRAGNQVGAWTTYDRKGAVYKVTQIESKPSKPGNNKVRRKNAG